MELRTLHHFIGRLPNNIPYDQKVARWDHAIFLGMVFAAVFFCMFMLMLWRDLPFLPIDRSHHFVQWAVVLFKGSASSLTHGKLFEDFLPIYERAMTTEPYALMIKARAGVAGTLALGIWFLIGSVMAKPRELVRHLSGPQLKRGREAIKAAQLESKRCANRFMFIHPEFWMESGEWSKSILISGGVGSGKTVILMGVFRQIFEKNERAIIYDVKGDFTERLSDKAAIISPFDKRSLVWNIAKDIGGNPAAIKAVADGFFPEDDPKNKFFTEAARGIMVAIIKFLYQSRAQAYKQSVQIRKKKHDKLKLTDPEQTILNLEINDPWWTWSDLAGCFKLEVAQLRAIMKKFNPSMEAVLSENGGSTTESVLSTLKIGAAQIDNIASAWTEEQAEQVGEFSFVDWARDSYIDPDEQLKRIRKLTKKKYPSLAKVPADLIKRFAPRQIIVQNGQPRSLGNAYIGAIFECLIPNIISGAFPDADRSLFFICDEFPTMGKINFEQLITVGRSKGVKTILLYQDIAQLKEIYGENIPKTLQASVNTQIICKLGPGETRQYVAQNVLGKRTVAVTKATYQADGSACTSFEQLDLELLKEGDLTSDLGPQFYKSKGERKLACVRSLLLQGEHALILDFPLVPAFCKKRDALVKANWNKGKNEEDAKSKALIDEHGIEFDFDETKMKWGNLQSVQRLFQYYFPDADQKDASPGDAAPESASHGNNRANRTVDVQTIPKTEPDRKVDLVGLRSAKNLLDQLKEEKVRSGDIKSDVAQEIDQTEKYYSQSNCFKNATDTITISEQVVWLSEQDEDYQEALELLHLEGGRNYDKADNNALEDPHQDYGWVSAFDGDPNEPEPLPATRGDNKSDVPDIEHALGDMVSKVAGQEIGHAVELGLEAIEMADELISKPRKKYVLKGDSIGKVKTTVLRSKS